jgi:hypothetical protein
VRKKSEAGESSGNTARFSEDDYWELYFSDPSQWWDNRLSKKNPKAPDFKHKTLKKALWIQGWYTPEWVKEKFSLAGFKD